LNFSIVGPAAPPERQKGIAMVSVYVLALLVLALVIYLFYAVINPEKF